MSAITAEEMRELVARALAEDLGDGDVTGEATVPAEATATARIVQKAPGVVFGLDLVVETMAQTGVEEVRPLAPRATGARRCRPRCWSPKAPPARSSPPSAPR